MTLETSTDEHLEKNETLLPPNTPEVPNPSVHLAFFDISLLFGGHWMLATNDPNNPNLEAIHQICHKDGERKENLVKDNTLLEGKYQPGSFIIPLQAMFAHPWFKWLPRRDS